MQCRLTALRNFTTQGIGRADSEENRLKEQVKKKISYLNKQKVSVEI